MGGAPVAHAEHGFKVAARHFFAAQKQVVQAALGLLAHALFGHGGLKHQAGFDGLKVEQAGHEADLRTGRCPARSPPRQSGSARSVAAPVQIATAQAVGVGR